MCQCVQACPCAQVSFFPQQGQKYFDHYAEALIYHCSNISCITDFLLAITAFLLHRLPVFPSSRLARIKNATRSVQKWNCAHLPEDNTVLISHSGSPCRFMSGLVSYACFNSDNHMNNAWCLLCVCHPRPLSRVHEHERNHCDGLCPSFCSVSFYS